jgi:hypothetical protein
MGVFEQYRDEWGGIYFMDKKCGYSHTKIERRENEFNIIEDIELNLSVMGVPQHITVRINAVTGRDMRVKVFSFRLASGIVKFIAYGSIDNHTLRITVTSGGKEKEHTLTLDEIPVPSFAVKYYLLNKGIKKGATYTRAVFDPMTMSTRKLMLTVEGEETVSIGSKKYACFRIRQRFNGVHSLLWISDEGETIREESPMGFVLRKESPHDAVNSFWGDRPDVVTATAVPVDTRLSTEHLHFLKVKLDNVSLDGFDVDGGRQQLSGTNIITINREDLGAHDTYRLPCREKRYSAYLESSSLVQSDDPSIRTLVNFITKNTTDARTAVSRINHWVYENITKKPTMSIPSATEVLKTRQGDCNEHAVLMAALCRAAGIPSRLCAGIVYMNGKFFYHAWVETYLSRWVTADPTLDQFPADVSHIRFIEGDIERQIQVLTLVGNLRITIMEQK